MLHLTIEETPAPHTAAPLPGGRRWEEPGPARSQPAPRPRMLPAGSGRSRRAPAASGPGPRADGGGRAPGSLSDGVEFKKRSLNATQKCLMRWESSRHKKKSMKMDYTTIEMQLCRRLEQLFLDFVFYYFLGWNKWCMVFPALDWAGWIQKAQRLSPEV
nr:transmembrane protein 267 isoform X2 [Taeniopygia guttata]